MIGISQNNPGIDVGFKFALVNGLNGAGRSYRMKMGVGISPCAVVNKPARAPE